MKKVIILSDRTLNIEDQINLGDRALTLGLYRLVQKHFGGEIISGGWKNFPYFNIRMFRPDATEEDIRQVFMRWVNTVQRVSPAKAKKEEEILKKLERSFLFKNPVSKFVDGRVKMKNSRGLFAPLKPYLFRNHYAHQFREKIRSADLVLNNGAGLITDRLERFVPMSMFECFYAKKMGKKVAAINQTVDVRKQLNKDIVGFVYRQLDFHLVRESLSAEKLLELGISRDRIMTQPDAAFAAPYETDTDIEAILQKEQIPKGSIGMTIRGDREVDAASWGKLITFLHEQFAKEIFFIHSNKAHDSHVLRKLKAVSPIRTVNGFYNYPDFVSIIGKFDLFITDRYHGAVFASIARTPFVPIKTRTVKLEGFLQLIDYSIEALPELSADCLEQYKTTITYAYAMRNELKREITVTKQQLSHEIHETYRQLGEILQ